MERSEYMSNNRSRLTRVLAFAVFAGNLYAVDGVVLIDQARALAGSITPGDAPGFPVTISQPGSYRLSGNLRVPSAIGIEITADDVSIDLNGFAIFGNLELNSTGIVDIGARRRIAVRNGRLSTSIMESIFDTSS
jgi:hypothetical protein